MTWRRRGTPIRLQIIALIAFSQIISSVLTFCLVHGVLGSGSAHPRAVAAEVLGPFNAVVGATLDLTVEQRRAAIASLVKRDDRFIVLENPEIEPEAELWPAGKLYLGAARDGLSSDLHQDIVVVRRDIYQYFPLSAGNYGIAQRLEGDEWLVFTPAPTTPARLLPIFMLLLAIVLLLLPASAFLLWATGTLVAPLRRLAAAAEGFSRNLGAEAAPERGSAEVRTVARAFNTMRARLKAMIDAKSYTLAAIGHDLKTPLTRMRLRLESGAPDRDALVQDVRAMEVMVASALSFIRDGEAELNLQPLDLAALTQTVCDDLADVGQDVELVRSDRVVVEADANLMRRALINIIENGVTYGTRVVVSVGRDDASGMVRVDVADNGPGLSAEDYEKAVEPFWRGDAARGGGTGAGFGLGLSIAQSIVERHRGALSLRPNQPHGLIVRLAMPMAAPAGFGAVEKETGAPQLRRARQGVPSGGS
ncbi:MAG: HAMP domain-containing sensor histidine kinase [Pseudomonadota bacterium]